MDRNRIKIWNFDAAAIKLSYLSNRLRKNIDRKLGNRERNRELLKELPEYRLETWKYIDEWIYKRKYVSEIEKELLYLSNR